MLALFQSIYSLLKASTSSPRFIAIPSWAASLTAFIYVPAGHTCYGASNIPVNYIGKKNFESDWIIFFPLASGILQTDMCG
ncbi:hypothetical protein ARMSODRAFT_1027773 [Armillaria solidipes]|uniref:Uncharacterized protein n=1 Tax=Armillaria solidipes TaxID=1076256 RepID=A0A2H3AMT8_9AGAR|nr:hypothetical protein ARMSODRAFT_1027773 [Armillaria solidipes]